MNKLVAICVDNTNINFGGSNRTSSNNAWRRIENLIRRQINGIGCSGHIVHNCLQTAVDCLPFDIESFTVKGYKNFCIYAVRVEELKGFCEFARENYSKLLKHGNSKFLSLGPSVERILNMFKGLNLYFCNKANVVS
jgi:hypothetical protein